MSRILIRTCVRHKGAHRDARPPHAGATEPPPGRGSGRARMAAVAQHRSRQSRKGQVATRDPWYISGGAPRRGGTLGRRRTLVVLALAGAAGVAAAVAAHRSRHHAATAPSASGDILIGNVSLYDVLTGRLLGPFYRGVAADVAAAAGAGARVLEVGCGPGHLSLLLARDHDLDVTAVDVDPAMIERARAKADGTAAANPTFAVGDAASLQFVDGTFDVVVSTLSMHHWDDPVSGLAEIGRVLRPGGRALVWDLHPHRRLLLGPHHGDIPDPAVHAADAGLETVDVTPWRWPWRFTLVQRAELARPEPDGAAT